MLGLIIMVKLNLSKSEMDVNFRTTPATVNNRNFTLQIHIENYKRFHIVGRKFTVLLSGGKLQFRIVLNKSSINILMNFAYFSGRVFLGNNLPISGTLFNQEPANASH